MQPMQGFVIGSTGARSDSTVSDINKVQPLSSGVGGKGDRGWFIAMEPLVSFEVCIISAYYLFKGITELHRKE